MSDPLDQLKQWREVTEAATEGPWVSGDPGFGAVNGSNVVSIGAKSVGTDIVRARGESDGKVTPDRVDAEFIAISRTAMPALLTAVENVLKLHRELANSSSALYSVPLCACGSGYPCLTVDAVRDALGGAK